MISRVLLCLEALYSALVEVSMAKKLDLCSQAFIMRSKLYKCAFLILFWQLPLTNSLSGEERKSHFPDEVELVKIKMINSSTK